MWTLKLKPREFRFRAGARTELDRSFLKIVNALAENVNLSEYIKKAVVENYLRDNEVPEVDRLLQELSEIAAKYREIKVRLKVIAAKSLTIEEQSELEERLREIEEEMTIDKLKIGNGE